MTDTQGQTSLGGVNPQQLAFYSHHSESFSGKLLINDTLQARTPGCLIHASHTQGIPQQFLYPGTSFPEQGLRKAALHCFQPWEHHHCLGISKHRSSGGPYCHLGGDYNIVRLGRFITVRIETSGSHLDLSQTDRLPKPYLTVLPRALCIGR